MSIRLHFFVNLLYNFNSIEIVLEELISNDNWPLKIVENNLWEYKTIRPNIKILEQIREINEKKTNWEEKEISLKELHKEEFRKYVADLDLFQKEDVSKFYKILKSILKYKQGKCVKDITEGETIHFDDEKAKLVKGHFSKLYSDEIRKIVIRNNGIFNYEVNVESALNKISKGKACDLDNIPDTVYRWKETQENLKQKLKEKFSTILKCGEVPPYFMKARLILLSKDNTDCPEITRVRPISIPSWGDQTIWTQHLGHIGKSNRFRKFHENSKRFYERSQHSR